MILTLVIGFCLGLDGRLGISLSVSYGNWKPFRSVLSSF